MLNEKEVELDPKDIVITDGEKPVMMAGVMGGLNSEITSETTDVILESAIFDPTLVRKAALRHANRTEASSRYEKGTNWDATEKAINMAALLLRMMLVPLLMKVLSRLPTLSVNQLQLRLPFLTLTRF